ncbi:DUF389 domain-containing protein [Leptolyngbya sp. FACHB-541]|uniref:DUF389 domain-containing protein n=1 Tax=Leptolyngbya sp. FACHB-541 TaxID=2692810 RepID=UPI0016860CF8|nr:DUF389 domain-containing protein [Leptolyngbya sp. FACHB-541]MBD1999255.1 DUF389 domain-containing protein [Leptolyngbya sp. FACHB-541]
MRQLLIQVPRGYGKDVLDTAKAHDGANLSLVEATGSKQSTDLVTIHVSNRKVEGLLEALEGIPDLQITLNPRGVLTLQPPADEAAQQVTDVAVRSPIEVFLSGLQSVGSWQGFLGYAAAAGVVVWIGLFTNTTYLLVAAMLIAPFAGPAMNVALATARGDRYLLGRSLVRYFAALIVTIAVTAFLSFVLRQQVTTEQMAATSTISAVAVFLPVVAGAAGALNLVQSERSSLVSGAATGMLVAASLAPPAGLVGMAGAMGRWDLTINGVFVLLLQLVGINLSAAIVFRLYGISAQGTRYKRGKAWAFPAILTVTVVAIAGLLTWQFSSLPNLQRSSLTQRATADIKMVVDESGLAKLVEANVRFTRPDIQGQNTLLATVYVQQQSTSQSTEAIQSQLTQDIQTHLLNQGFNVTPLVNVTVLQAPESP